jgi:hypothetical protein
VLSARVFEGALVVLRGLPATTRLVEAARAVAVAHLGAEPWTVHERLGVDDLAETARGAQVAFTRDPALRQAFADLLAEAGLDRGRTFWDRLHLRVLPPVAHGADARTVDAPHRPITSTRWHRDTWGSGVRAQVNWWLPLWPLSADRTLQLLPGAWDREVPNTSAAWDVTALGDPRARARMPLIPEVTAAVDEDDAVRPVPAVGEVLVFSGAHLHGTVPNTTAVTRLSVESRTVGLDDVLAGRGAPARDSRPPHVAWHWFRGVEDGRSLAEVVGT